jgi:hypothetical protein
VVSPYFSLLGKLTAREAVRGAGKGGRTKRKPFCNETDKGCAEGNITLRESEQTSVWSFRTRELDKPLKKGKQMTAETISAGAPFHGEVNWSAINWRKVHQTVRRLQARIVGKA